ncbi:MAG: flagellar assembly protein FliW [Opitutales bacterium]
MATADIEKNEAGLDTSIVELPEGIIGFPEMKEAEIVFSEEELPFLRLRDKQPGGLTLLVVEPGPLVPGYQPEILDNDLGFLEITKPEEVLLLNIASIHEQASVEVTLNLVGPIVVNRRNRRARQVVIGNFQNYTARFKLFEAEGD